MRCFTKHGKKLSNCLNYTTILSKTKFKEKRGKGLTPQQMLQRLPITLAKLKASNTSKNLKKQIRKIIIYSLYRAKNIQIKQT